MQRTSQSDETSFWQPLFTAIIPLLVGILFNLGNSLSALLSRYLNPTQPIPIHTDSYRPLPVPPLLRGSYSRSPTRSDTRRHRSVD